MEILKAEVNFPFSAYFEYSYTCFLIFVFIFDWFCMKPRTDFLVKINFRDCR